MQGGGLDSMVNNGNVIESTSGASQVFLKPRKGRGGPRFDMAERIVVAIDASKEITKNALEWALTNVAVQEGHCITLLALFPSGTSGKFLSLEQHHISENSQIFIFWAVQCLMWRPSISPFIQVLYVLEWQLGKYGGFQLCGHCWVVIVDLGLDELVAWVLGQLNLRLKARSRELAPP
jgi:hypothetical protein